MKYEIILFYKYVHIADPEAVKKWQQDICGRLGLKGRCIVASEGINAICTGGVRCEKASGFLMTQGFTDVYQLDGGIVSYMERYPNENFKGKLYVFDGRVTMGPSALLGTSLYSDDPKCEIIGKCDICREPSENYVNCANPVCHRHFINCQKCLRESEDKAFCPGGCVISRHGRKISPIEANLVKSQ